MKALCFFKDRGLKLCSKPVPKIQNGEALVKVKGCTICGSDLRVLRGEKEVKRDGIVLGHEIWGEVVESKSPALKEGRCVSLYPSLFCGRCPMCLKGLHHLCSNKCSYGSCMDGGFAEYVKVPASVIEAGGFYETEHHSLVNCLIEPLGCVLHSFKVMEVSPSDRVLILGGGPLGLMHLIVAAMMGAQVSLVERNGHRREVAQQLYKGVRTYSSVEELKGGFTVAFICAPAFDRLNEVVERMERRGRINLFAGGAWSKRAEFTPNLIHYRELVLTGTHSTTVESFHAAGRLLEKEIERFSRLLTHVLPIERFAEAFSIYEYRKGLKVAISPNYTQLNS